MKVAFLSSLSVDECIQRIESDVINNGLPIIRIFMAWDLDKKFFYNRRGNKFRIERVHYRNIYRPVFTGKLVNQNEKTRIEGDVHTNWYANIFEIIWFTFGILISGFSILYSIINIHNTGLIRFNNLVMMIAPVFLIIFGIVSMRTMKRQAKDWEKETLDFIEKTCEASRIL